ncbi:alpha/beta fold hydrolase [Tsukamurella sp. 8F]|uniref:esterase/lipase family protein n=1 Tax=unclassified Tsukamurella TaxID=2633480 RepID=UPI0023B9D1BB|nr:MULTISPECIES: alpha/beta fold hydrolase [unclassified Tsukamurella]MDF0529713.1 alpha/beta fold hydrolase [Tsukamurella sp. 8J]MDF0585998.1 alpha/beta fold hydrolase [Tsukamurella sp. 8F]
MDRRPGATAEVRALARLGCAELSGATSGTHRVHRAISDRVFAGVGLGVGAFAAPVKALHDGITDGVYLAITTAMDTAGEVGGRFADLGLTTPPSETVRGAALIGVIQGLIGDDLEATKSPLAAEPMTVRVAGRAVPLDADRLTGAFPEARSRLVVFLHGLVETEHAWSLGGGPTFGERLAAEGGVSPVFVRYNTGRRISENGRALAELLEGLVDGWPVPIEDVVLVGHSMGGLVARSAAHHAETVGMAWPAGLSATVTLGTPHLGAPLETLAHYGSAALVKLPETAPFGRMLRRRSGGIRDLRAGSIVDEDWSGRDADALGRAAAAEIPLPVGSAHYFVAATVTRSRRNPVGRVVGDGLVLLPSASGRSRARRICFDPANGMHLPRAHHFTLLHDEAVYARLREWVRG